MVVHSALHSNDGTLHVSTPMSVDAAAAGGAAADSEDLAIVPVPVGPPADAAQPAGHAGRRRRRVSITVDTRSFSKGFSRRFRHTPPTRRDVARSLDVMQHGNFEELYTHAHFQTHANYKFVIRTPNTSKVQQNMCKLILQLCLWLAATTSARQHHEGAPGAGSVTFSILHR